MYKLVTIFYICIFNVQHIIIVNLSYLQSQLQVLPCSISVGSIVVYSCLVLTDWFYSSVLHLDIPDLRPTFNNAVLLIEEFQSGKSIIYATGANFIFPYLLLSAEIQDSSDMTDSSMLTLGIQRHAIWFKTHGLGFTNKHLFQT